MSDLMPGARSATALAATCVVAATLLAASATYAGAPAPYPLMAPFGESAPPLAEAQRCLGQDPPPATDELEAALGAVTAWRQSPEADADPLALRTAQWLSARLLLHLGRPDAARALLDGLIDRPGAFDDAARRLHADTGQGRALTSAAAKRHLTIRPHNPGWFGGVLASLDALSHRRRYTDAVDLLEPLLDWSMTTRERHQLMLRLGELKRLGGDLDGASNIFGRLWWDPDIPDAIREEARKRLTAMKRPIRASDRIARRALFIQDDEAARYRRRLARRKTKHRFFRSVLDWGVALTRRFDSRGVKRALRRVRALGTRLGKERFEPVYLFGRASVEAAAGEVLVAARTYAQIGERWPDHPLAERALQRARRHFVQGDDDTAAGRIDTMIVGLGHRGSAHRAALWRLGLAAFVAGDHSTAAQHFGALDRRYGGERDGYGMVWAERAGYWRGRTSEAMGRSAEARAWFVAVAARFPASWYGLMARARLDDDPADHQVIARPELDTAVALLRLGAHDDARRALRRLVETDNLPGAERLLLADLYRLEGNDQHALRLEKHRLIPPTMPDAPQLGAYRDWYPWKHGEALVSAAEEHRVPTALLAGIVSIESGFDASVTSRVGARGLCQLMPRTAKAHGRRLMGKRFRLSKLADPRVNLRLGAYHLARLEARYGSHPVTLAAAYNAGGVVSRWVADRGDLPIDLFVETIPYPQTRRYVKRVMAHAEIYRRLYALGDAMLAFRSPVRP